MGISTLVGVGAGVGDFQGEETIPAIADEDRRFCLVVAAGELFPERKGDSAVSGDEDFACCLASKEIPRAQQPHFANSSDSDLNSRSRRFRHADCRASNRTWFG